jgi:hypothetical protein
LWDHMERTWVGCWRRVGAAEHSSNLWDQHEESTWVCEQKYLQVMMLFKLVSHLILIYYGPGTRIV